ncbi:hypothetical protein MJN85_31675, partial [Salmonella enterica subsp. enterica serovar Anatum]|nr:hypothetical protein [Salmonella enterica subsp. enterica serovar Anatum]
QGDVITMKNHCLEAESTIFMIQEELYTNNYHCRRSETFLRPYRRPDKTLLRRHPATAERRMAA